jgi:ABC-2 type transport system ATP-binding protein
MAVIETRGLTRRFNRRIAVEDLTLEVSEGEILGFLGPNGAGKTTTIRMLAGIIAPTSGHAVVAGFRTDQESERLHEVIGLLPEVPGFYERLSAWRNLEFFARFYRGLDIDSQVEKYLRLMGLWERRGDRVTTFSKGMKMRLALARALLHEPKVLFFDEPTAGLDPEVAREIRGLILRLGEEGKTVFLSTHNLAEAEQLCRRIAVVRTRLIALDTAERLRNRLYRPQLVVKLTSVSESLLIVIQSLPFVRHLRQAGNQLTLELTNLDQDRPELVRRIVEAGGQVLEVSEQPHTLEDVYLSLVREEGAR